MPPESFSEQDPVTIAQDRFGVDLTNERAVLKKLIELHGGEGTADLSNLWRTYDESRRNDAQEAA